MNLTSPSQVKALIEDLGISPNKVMGQNFLIDRNILDIILASAELSPADRILEVGGGLGVLTEQLAARSGELTVIEKDRGLADHLKSEYGDICKLIHADALKILKSGELNPASFNKFVSNLPYSVGTRIIAELITSSDRPELIVVTLQHEVAGRLAARPRSRDYGMLSVWAQLFYDVKLVKSVSHNCFFPRPEVKSAILSMKLHGKYKLADKDLEKLYKLTKYAFAHRRKQIVKILHGAPEGLIKVPEEGDKVIAAAGLDPRARPESMCIQDWINLVTSISA